ncbi:thioredoxin family protein [Aquimarina sp. SS2-1]|uniref:thioredoxin family protein n=1 Tax=Aquimarina besae TaxID=3342247 RepID=UPI00366C6035
MRKIIFIMILMLMGLGSLTAQEWLTDFNEAKKNASDTNKHIVLVFAGSDWCAPCIKLERQILNTEKFLQYAKENYILVKADFPRKKKNQLPKELQEQNTLLAEAYNKSGGFPLVVLLDKEGKKLGEIGYKKVTPDGYIEILNKMIR